MEIKRRLQRRLEFKMGPGKTVYKIEDKMHDGKAKDIDLGFTNHGLK